MKKLISPLMTLVIGSSLTAAAFASSSVPVQNNISASAMATGMAKSPFNLQQLGINPKFRL